MFRLRQVLQDWLHQQCETQNVNDLNITSVALAGTQLVFATQFPASVLASVDFDPSPIVNIEDTSGSIISSETTAVSLTAWGDNLCSNAPIGILSAPSGGTTGGVATFTNVNHDRPETIFIRASASGFSNICSNAIDVIGTGYVVQIDPIYDVGADTLVITASLLRNGTLITDSANMSLTSLDISNDAGVSYLASGGASYASDPEITMVPDPNNSIFHTTWAPVAGLTADTAYSVPISITYNGIVYQGFKSVTVNQLGVIKVDLLALDTKLDDVQTTVSGIETKAIAVDTSVLSLDTKISAHAASQAAYRALTTTKLAGIKTKIGAILVDTSKTVPDAIKTTIAAQLAKGDFTEIVTTQAEVKTGATIPFRYRTASGLTPKVTVLDPKEAGKIVSAPMKEVSGTGIYVYNIEFKTVWGLGNFMISVNEISKGSVDHIVLKVVEDVEATKKAKAAATTSAVTLDTLYSRITSINSNMDTLSSGMSIVKDNTENVGSDIDALLDEVDDGTSSGTAIAGNLEKFGKYMNSVVTELGISSTVSFKSVK